MRWTPDGGPQRGGAQGFRAAGEMLRRIGVLAKAR